MTNEDKILEQIAALTRSHEAFVAEWRATRDEAKARTDRVLAESERRRTALDKKTRWINIIFVSFMAIVGASYIIFLLFGRLFLR